MLCVSGAEAPQPVQQSDADPGRQEFWPRGSLPGMSAASLQVLWETTKDRLAEARTTDEARGEKIYMSIVQDHSAPTFHEA